MFLRVAALIDAVADDFDRIDVNVRPLHEGDVVIAF
jgi:hypothetical protein